MLETVQSVPLTFYSRKFYIELMRQWKGVGFGFIILLTLINVVWIGTKAHAPLSEAAQQLETAADDLPEFAFKDHKLSIDKPSPFSLTVFQSEKQPNRVVIDTGFKVADVPTLVKHMEKERIFALLTADTFITQKASGEVDINTYSKISNQVITHDQWASVGKIIHKAFVPIALIAVAVALLVGEFVLVLIAATIGKILAAMMSVTLEFGAAMRMAAATHMPIGLVSTFVGLPVFVIIVVWLGYAVFSLISLKQAGKQAI